MKTNINPELAEICGIHAGDGYLRNDGKRKEWDISGSFEEKEYYDKHMIPLFNKIFRLNITGRFFASRGTYGFVIRNRETVEFAHNTLGFPYGNKSQKIKVPRFILDDPSLIIHFLRGYFDTDGHFSCGRKPNGKYCKFKRKFHYYPKIRFSTVSPTLSNQLNVLLRTLGLGFCSYTHQPKIKTESLKYIYEINGAYRAQKFMNLVKPKNNIKLSRYIIWKRHGFCPTNITYQQRKNILNGKLDPKSLY